MKGSPISIWLRLYLKQGSLNIFRSSAHPSAFYGVLRPMDGVTPYRLEMQARAAVGVYKDLYALWGNRLYEAVRDESGIILNLASKEYPNVLRSVFLKKTDIHSGLL